MSDESTTPQKGQITDERPKHVLMRASLHRSAEEDKGLRASARSPRAEDDQKALEKLKAFMNPAAPCAVIGTDWDYGNSRRWPWSAEAEKEAFVFHEEQLSRPATFRAAKFQFSRSFGRTFI